MAMQIVTGIKKGTEVLINENQKQVNYTEILEEICSAYLKEMNFTEDGEEITYRVIGTEHFLEITRLICEKQEIIMGEMKEVRGNDKRKELFNTLQDYILIMSVFIEAISLSQNSSEVYLILV